MRSYSTIRALHRGEIVNLEGLLFIKAEGEIRPGDTYIAERSTVGIYVARISDTRLGCILPEGLWYAFNISECVKVEEAGTEPDCDGFTLNGLVRYQHHDLEQPCTGACCEPEAYVSPYRWPCQIEGCMARMRLPGECINCTQPLVTTIGDVP